MLDQNDKAKTACTLMIDGERSGMIDLDTAMLDDLNSMGFLIGTDQYIVDHTEVTDDGLDLHLKIGEPSLDTKLTLTGLVTSRASDFDALVEELTSILYAGFEAGGAAGNLPKLREMVEVPDDWGDAADWLVVPNRETLEHSIREILDGML